MTFCTCVLDGRLGNHMFQIAAGFAHAKRSGHHFVIDESNPEYLKYPNYWTGILAQCAGQFVRPLSITTTKYMWRNRWAQPSFTYSPIPSSALCLVGFFQTSKYFADASGDVRALFQPPLLIQNDVHSTHASLLTERHRTVAIHIRRKDYFISYYAKTYGILSHIYFTRAMDLAISKDPGCQFAIFSDDIEWCKKQPWLSRQSCVFVDEPDESKALYLMSLFDSFIISNSSYSWWAAYLAGSRPAITVWAPDTWIGPSKGIDCRDVYEDSWIRVPIA